MSAAPHRSRSKSESVPTSDPNYRGRGAASPFAVPLKGWKDVLVRTWAEAGDDNIGLIAAGVAFYGFLALVPLLGAFVLSYGLVAEPTTVMQNMQSLTSVMPADAAKLIGEQLMNVVKTSDGKKGLGLLLALGIALFGARNAAGSIVTALNVAYEEKEKRGFIIVNLLSLAITAAGVLVAVLAVVAIAALGHLEELLPDAPGFVLLLGKLMSYLAVTLAGAAGAATLYRFGPSRERPKWTWLTPGSGLAAVLWLMLTLGFGLYVANFGNYNATYGSLGAVVVLLTWLYLSSYILLFGAELNSELEHQTARDTTSGPERPAGSRGAWAADNVADEADHGDDADPKPMAPAGDRRHIAADYAVGRSVNMAGRLADLPRLGRLPLAVAVIGLSLLRRRSTTWAGLGTVAVAAGLSWVAREKPDVASP